MLNITKNKLCAYLHANIKKDCIIESGHKLLLNHG